MKRVLGWAALVMVALVAGAAAMVVRPTDAPEYAGAAPALWEDGYIEHRTEAVMNMPPEVFAVWFKENPVVSFLKPVGSIPEIENVIVLEGEWFTAGSKRRVEFVDGATVAEQVVEFTPETFRYQAWGYTATARYILDHALGEIDFVPEGTGQTRVIWTYRMAPKAFFTRPMAERFMATEFAPFMDAGLTAMAAAANGG
jgi:hypothetical protein